MFIIISFLKIKYIYKEEIKALRLESSFIEECQNIKFCDKIIEVYFSFKFDNLIKK